MAEIPKNLIGKTFQKGVSGNPNGAPKGKRLSTILKEMLSATTPKEIAEAKFMSAFYTGKKRPTNAHVYAAQLLRLALVDGELGALREIGDRVDGKALQGLEVSGIDGQSIQAITRIILPPLPPPTLEPKQLEPYTDAELLANENDIQQTD